MKRECLHPHEVPVEVVAKLPGMPWYEKGFIGILIMLPLIPVTMILALTYEQAFKAGQEYGEEAYPDYLKVDLDPPRPMFRSLTIYDGTGYNYYYDGTKPISRY